MAKQKKKVDRSTITEMNRKRGRAKESARIARLVERTRKLINTYVAIRIKDHNKPLVGTVLEVITKGDERYPKDAARHSGNYLNVRTTIGDILVSRHRVKPIREDH